MRTQGIKDWWYFAGQGHMGPWRICPACQIGNLIAWITYRKDHPDETP
jgi:hypothetical protein